MGGYHCTISSDQRHRDKRDWREAKIEVNGLCDYNNPTAQGRLGHAWTLLPKTCSAWFLRYPMTTPTDHRLRKCATELHAGRSDGGIFSIQIHSSQMTLAPVKLPYRRVSTVCKQLFSQTLCLHGHALPSCPPQHLHIPLDLLFTPLCNYCWCFCLLHVGPAYYLIYLFVKLSNVYRAFVTWQKRHAWVTDHLCGWHQVTQQGNVKAAVKSR